MARGTIALAVPGIALGHFGSFLLFVLIPLVSWKNPWERKKEQAEPVPFQT